MDVPERISITATAPPVAREPSTVRSAKSKSLYVIYTPSAISPQTSPCAKAPGMERKRAIGSKDISIVIEKPLIKNIFYSAAMAV